MSNTAFYVKTVSASWFLKLVLGWSGFRIYDLGGGGGVSRFKKIEINSFECLQLLIYNKILICNYVVTMYLSVVLQYFFKLEF